MFIKRQLPYFITIIVFIIMVVSYFSPHPKIAPLRTKMQHWYMAIAAFTMIVGLLSLVRVHYKKIRRKKDRFQLLYSSTTLISLVVIIAFGLFGGMDHPVFDFMFDYMLVPLQAVMFSLLAFYIASASFRAFRAKSSMATVLLLAGFIVMLGRVPTGKKITGDLLGLASNEYLSFLHIPNLTEWIMNVINAAGQRAILIGAALGVIATSIKIVLGIERSHLGGE